MLDFNINDRTGLMIIDMQNDFVLEDGAYPAQNAGSIIAKTKNLIEVSKEKKFPIIYTQHIYRKDLSDFGVAKYFEDPCCLEGTDGAKIIKELTPYSDDVIIRKPRYDAFVATELDLILKNLDIKNIIVAGVYTDVCVLSTVYHARCLDYKVCVAKDCTAGSSEQIHKSALTILNQYSSQVVNLKEIKEIFSL